MLKELDARLNRLARRAGLRSAPPGAAMAVLCLGCVAVAIALWRWWPHAPAAGGAQTAGVAVTHGDSAAAGSSGVGAGGADSGAADATGTQGASQAATICVYVVGAVHRPGVYELSADARATDAIDDAGGFDADAAVETVNLAAKLDDGEQLTVPTRKQVADGTAAAVTGGGASGGGAAGGAASSGAGGSSAGSSAPVDINTADATQLDTLPGVGPSTAAKIVTDRQTNGPFKSPDDLGRVPGIGPKKLAQLKPLIVVH